MGGAIIAVIILLLILFNLDKIAAFFVSIFYISLIALGFYILFKLLNAICNYCEKRVAQKTAAEAAKAETERKKAKEANFKKQLEDEDIKTLFLNNNVDLFLRIVNEYFKKEAWTLTQDIYEHGTLRSVFLNDEHIYLYMGSGPDQGYNSVKAKWPEEKWMDAKNCFHNFKRIDIDIRNDLKILIPDLYHGIEKKVILIWFIQGIQNQLLKNNIRFDTQKKIETYYLLPTDIETSPYYHYFEYYTPRMELKALN